MHYRARHRWIREASRSTIEGNEARAPVGTVRKTSGKLRNHHPDTRCLSELAVAWALREAIRCDAIGLAYQPIVDAHDWQVSSYEALARWTHPGWGAVAPDIFIALAERHGLIDNLGERLLRLACRDAACWVDGPSVAVNISPLQLRRADFSAMVIAALVDSGLDPNRLILEITESAPIVDTLTAANHFHQLRNIGVRVHVDDLGCGYSTTDMLRLFSVDAVKIDRSCVAGAARCESRAAVLDAMIKDVRCRGIELVAEGIETPDQIDRLLIAGCTHFQGYFFGRPQPAENITNCSPSIPRINKPAMVRLKDALSD